MEFFRQKKNGWNSKYQDIPFSGSSGSYDKNGLTPHDTRPQPQVKDEVLIFGHA